MRRSRLHLLLPAAAYIAIALWSYRAVLAEPANLLPIVRERLGDATIRELYRSDHRFVVAVVADGARRLLGGDLHLLNQPTCYPFVPAGTLGEHMIGESLLGLVPYALTREPILVLNAVDVLSLWIAAVGMYALAFFWTASAGGAFVAGLLFAFHPARVTNPAHPFVYGNLWTPLVLLAAHHLATRGRWRDAVLLSAVLVLQLLESFYPVLALVLLGGTYGLFLLIRFRASLRALAPKLALVALTAASVAAALFLPYLETRSTWGTLQGRTQTVLLPLEAYLPGGSASPGLIPLALAAIALVDRLRHPRPRDGYDPRWPIALGGLLVLWATLGVVQIGSFRLQDASPLLWLRGVVPGLDAVRVLASLRFGVFVVVAFLSAYGVLALTELARGRLRGAVTAGLIGLAALEVLEPAMARSIYSWSPALVGEPERPPDDVVALFAAAPPGAVLDLPVPSPETDFSRMSRSILLSAYHERPVAACYNSFASPLHRDVAALSRRLPERAAVDALCALGFRVLVVHRRALDPETKKSLRPLLDDPLHTTRMGSTPDFDVIALWSWKHATDDFRALGPGDPPRELVSVESGASASIPFAIANLSGATFRHPEPIEPRALRVDWRDGRGRTVSRESVRALLPIALATGDQLTRKLVLAAPDEAGDYQVAVSLAESPEIELARTTVRVEPSGARREHPPAGAARKPDLEVRLVAEERRREIDPA